MCLIFPQMDNPIGSWSQIIFVFQSPPQGGNMVGYPKKLVRTDVSWCQPKAINMVQKHQPASTDSYKNKLLLTLHLLAPPTTLQKKEMTHQYNSTHPCTKCVMQWLAPLQLCTFAFNEKCFVHVQLGKQVFWKLMQHNTGNGDIATQNPLLLPWAVVPYVISFEMRQKSRGLRLYGNWQATEGGIWVLLQMGWYVLHMI